MLRKLDHLISLIEQVVIGSTMLAMTALIVINVVLRFLAGVTITWAEDLALFLLIGMSFFAAAYGTRLNCHISMSALYDALSGRTRQLLYIIGLLSSSVLSGFLFVWSLQVTRTIYELRGEVASMGFPKYVPYLIVSVALLLMAVHFLQRTIRFFNTGKTDEGLAGEE